MSLIKSLKVKLALPKTDYYLGEKLLDGDLLPQLCQESGCRLAIIADQAIKPLAERLKKKLGAHLFFFEGKEASKTRETKQLLEDALMKERFGRDTLLIALGGGVATDLAGYLASTYMRGVPLISIPTTLLAMVDAAIGGKCGVDTPFGKNLIGSFYFPKAVLLDPEVLSTLPPPEWQNGLAEILKIALAYDAPLWRFFEKHIDHWKHPKMLSELIRRAALAKIKVVSSDPEEKKGLRRILNFGHTTAHALEHISSYQIPHGIAVAMGTEAECQLSCRLGYLPEAELEKILSVYRKCEFPLSLPGSFKTADFLEAMRLDKKSKEGSPRFVLIDKIGHAIPFDGEYCRTVGAQDLEALSQFLEMK